MSANPDMIASGRYLPVTWVMNIGPIYPHELIPNPNMGRRRGNRMDINGNGRFNIHIEVNLSICHTGH
jgi:hypothetical protein